MNKFINMLFLGLSLLAFSACGSSDSSQTPSIENPIIESYPIVNLQDLEDGYIVSGVNDSGQNVTLSFCFDKYDYYSGDSQWYGYYTLNGQRINMFDETPTGGSYRIDTFNGRLEVGEIYTIDFQNDEIIVESIIDDVRC
jgi:hypothetical protein